MVNETFGELCARELACNDGNSFPGLEPENKPTTVFEEMEE